MAQNLSAVKVYYAAKILEYASINLRKNARLIFERQKAVAMTTFNNHPITVALENHTSGGVAHGTLFGFMGFYAGDNPIEPIREILEEAMIFQGLNKLSNKQVEVVYEAPNIQDIYEATPLPWADGRSWVEMLETKGIPGLGLYIGKDGKGRSQEGIQNTRSLLIGSKYPKTSYISKIIKDFQIQLGKALREELLFI